MKNRVFLAIILTLLCFVLLLTIPPLSALAAEEGENTYRVVIDDRADLLTEAEEAALYTTMEKVLPYGNAAFVSVSENAISTEQLAEFKYLEFFGDTSGALLIIDMANRYIQLIADKDVYKVVTKARCTEIVDNIYTYASKGQYVLCATKAFEQMTRLLEGEAVYYGYSMQIGGMEIVMTDYPSFFNPRNYCLILHVDGTGLLNMGDETGTELTWTDTELVSEGTSSPYTMEGDHLTLMLGDGSMTFIPAAEMNALLVGGA